MAHMAATPPAVPRAVRRGPRLLTDEQFAFRLNLLPTLIILTIVGYPIVNSFYLSMLKFNLRRPNRIEFVGLQNFITAFSDKSFLNSLGFTLTYTAITVTGVVVVSTLFALLLNETFKGRGMLRALILLPWAIPGVVSSMMWQWIFEPRVGALNGLLYQLGIISEYRTWLSDPATVTWVITIPSLWQFTPFATIVLLSALQAIPGELYEAGMVDRAGLWQRFRHITLPWLVQPLVIIMILQTMNGLKTFDIIYVLTGGGPGESTMSLAFLTYRVAFEFLDVGRGNAYAWIVALMTMLLAFFYLRLMYSKGEFEA